MKDEYKFPVVVGHKYGPMVCSTCGACRNYDYVPWCHCTALSLNNPVPLEVEEMTKVETQFSEDSRKCLGSELETGDIFQSCNGLAKYGRDQAAMYIQDEDGSAVCIRGGLNQEGLTFSEGETAYARPDTYNIRYRKVTIGVK